MNNIVGADLVSIDKAKVVKNYHDFLQDEDRIVGFSKQFPEYGEFMGSRKPVEQNIFKRSRPIDLSMDALNMYKPLFRDQKCAFIARHLVVKAAGFAFMHVFGTSMPDFRVLIVTDEDASKYTNVFVHNKNTNSEFKTLIRVL